MRSLRSLALLVGAAAAIFVVARDVEVFTQPMPRVLWVRCGPLMVGFVHPADAQLPW
jgi:hypothetical protein